MIRKRSAEVFFMFAFACIALLCIAAKPVSKTVTLRGYRVAQGINTPQAIRNIGLEVDSVMFREDVTRVYGRITGPHNTSARIDRIELRNGNETYVSNDIDGFEYTRAFQWEEDGALPVEIDFAPIVSRPSIFLINAQTPKGVCTWSVTKTR